MGRTPNIPHELTHRPFSLDEARAGMTLSALRGKSWARIGSKLYRWNGKPPDPTGVIMGFWRTLPPSAVFVEQTAAWLHGLDVKATDPVHVALGQDCGLRSRAGLAIAHAEVQSESLLVRGLPATSLNRTLRDICAAASGLEALIVLDLAVNARLTTADQLFRYAVGAQGKAGSARMRELARWAAPAESPMETRLRWLLLKAGLPMPEVQSDLFDCDGRFLARADLYYPSVHLAIEFDGGNHRDRLVSDDRRQNALVAAGYRIVRFTSSDVYGNPGALVAQVRSMLSDPSL